MECEAVSWCLGLEQRHEASQDDEAGWQPVDAGAVCVLKVGKDYTSTQNSKGKMAFVSLVTSGDRHNFCTSPRSRVFS